MAHPFLGLGFNSWTQKFGRSAASAAALTLVVGAKFQDNVNGTDRGAVFIFDVNDLTTSTKVICETDTSIYDFFSDSVAIGDSKILVGMPQADINGSGSGAAYIYNLDGTGETQFLASDGASGDGFGISVAIGNSKIAIGARDEDEGANNAGAVYVYNLDGTGEIKITASDAANSDSFGSAVAIGNNKLYVGAPGDDDGGTSAGSVYIYNLDGTGENKLTPSDSRSFAYFGNALAFGHDKIVVGAYSDDPFGAPPGGGSVYVFDADGTNEVKIRSSDVANGDDFGHAIAIGNNKIVVGAPSNDDDGSGSGSAYVFNLDGTGQVKITASDAAADDNFGSSVAIGGDKIYVGARYEDNANGTNSGAFYAYNLDGTGEVKVINPENDNYAVFGWSMALGS